MFKTPSKFYFICTNQRLQARPDWVALDAARYSGVDRRWPGEGGMKIIQYTSSIGRVSGKLMWVEALILQGGFYNRLAKQDVTSEEWKLNICFGLIASKTNTPLEPATTVMYGWMLDIFKHTLRLYIYINFWGAFYTVYQTYRYRFQQIVIIHNHKHKTLFIIT